MTPEGRVKEKVKKALATLGAYRFMPVQNGMGAPALDLYCCIDGAFVAIETKVPGKKMTPRQRLTAQEIAKARGAVFVIHDEAEVVEMLQTLSTWLRGGIRRAGFINGD